MGQQYIDVEVTVTTTVTYRLPRPSKAEVVEYSGSDAWDKDDPEGSIREYLESQGIDEFIRGHRPISVVIEDKELVDVMPAGRGQKPQDAAPFFRVKAAIKLNDNALAEAWWSHGSWRRVGSVCISGEPLTSEECQSMASSMRKVEARKLIERFSEGGIDHHHSISDLELVPYKPSL
jgi:hypothetical protein